MTTNDIEKMQILLCCKNGEKLLGVTSDKFLLNYIVEFVKFVHVEGGKFFELSIKELLEDKNDNLK